MKIKNVAHIYTISDGSDLLLVFLIGKQARNHTFLRNSFFMSVAHASGDPKNPWTRNIVLFPLLYSDLKETHGEVIH